VALVTLDDDIHRLVLATTAPPPPPSESNSEPPSDPPSELPSPPPSSPPPHARRGPPSPSPAPAHPAATPVPASSEVLALGTEGADTGEHGPHRSRRNRGGQASGRPKTRRLKVVWPASTQPVGEMAPLRV
jgi:hypothetical protein